MTQTANTIEKSIVAAGLTKAAKSVGRDTNAWDVNVGTTRIRIWKDLDDEIAVMYVYEKGNNTPSVMRFTGKLARPAYIAAALAQAAKDAR
jgi:uncharacterized membrane protein